MDEFVKLDTKFLTNDDLLCIIAAMENCVLSSDTAMMMLEFFNLELDDLIKKREKSIDKSSNS